MNIKKLKNFAKKIRKNIIFSAFKAGSKSAHIGGALSATDIMAVLYSEIMKIKKISLKRIAKTNEIADVITFLASNKSSYINGQNIIVDGGYL